MSSGNTKKGFNLLDIFLVGFALLAGAAVYFTLVKPVRFSNMIIREGISVYAEVDIALADDLEWIADDLPQGLEFKNVYGAVDWKILNVGLDILGKRPVRRVRVKLLTTRETSGLLRYGKYTLVKGGRVILINDDFLIEGRVIRYHLLDEKIRL